MSIEIIKEKLVREEEYESIELMREESERGRWEIIQNKEGEEWE